MLTCWSGHLQDEVWIEPRWPDWVRGLFSFRGAGVSETPYSSLNVGLHVGDNAEAVIANRIRCAKRLGCDADDFVFAEQVHGNRVVVIRETDKGRGVFAREDEIPDADAMVTNISGAALAVLVADCVPVIFLDTVRRVIGVAHSGWKGTVTHISRSVVETMRREYGTEPRDLEVWLGPSIRQCCYEVDGPVVDEVTREFGTAALLPSREHHGKFMLSLQTLIRFDLLKAGVEPSRIRDTGVCTSCRPNRLFSHRKENGRTGRLVAAVRLVSTVEGEHHQC